MLTCVDIKVFTLQAPLSSRLRTPAALFVHGRSCEALQCLIVADGHRHFKHNQFCDWCIQEALGMRRNGAMMENPFMTAYQDTYYPSLFPEYINISGIRMLAPLFSKRRIPTTGLCHGHCNEPMPAQITTASCWKLMSSTQLLMLHTSKRRFE